MIAYSWSNFRVIAIITKSSSYHYEIKKIDSWPYYDRTAIRVEKIKISRKGDFHKISLITLWDRLGKNDFNKVENMEKNSLLIVLWSWLANREKEIEISRKGDFHKIDI